MSRFCEGLTDGTYEKTLDKLAAREISPQQAVEALVNGGKL
jgi:hypothetical protein